MFPGGAAVEGGGDVVEVDEIWVELEVAGKDLEVLEVVVEFEIGAGERSQVGVGPVGCPPCPGSTFWRRETHATGPVRVGPGS